MKTNFFKKLSIMTLIMFLVSGFGCSTVKSTYRLGEQTAKSLTNKLKAGEDPILKKRVLVPHIIDQAGIGEENTAKITDDLVSLLREDSHLLVKKLSEPLSTGDNIRSPQYGVIIEPSLIEMAEKMGMDVLLLGVLNPFESTVKNTGIWPLRKIKREVEMSVALNALNITNSTLFLTHLETREIKFEEKEADTPNNKKSIDFKYLEAPLSEIMEDHVSELTFELNNQSWEGKIAVTGDGSLRINGGSAIGVVKGQVFEVFGKGEPITSVDGREYYIRGKRIGELRADVVMQDYSFAAPVTGDQFEEGQIVRVKR